MDEIYLKEKLSELKWSYKFEIYNQVINNFSIRESLSEIENSVIVVAHKYSYDLIMNLKELNKQKSANSEIIFVNNNILNENLNEIDKYIDVKINLTRNTGACVARNIGAIFSRGNLLIFVDDDGIPDENFLNGHILTHKIFNVFTVRGVCLPKTNSILMDHYCLGEEVCSSYCNLEGNFSIASNVFFDIGGWNDNLFYGHEGIELSYRLLNYYSDFSKQIYSPLPILYHDYVEDASKVNLKLKKLEMSKEKILKMSPMFESIVDLWSNLKSQSIKIDYNMCSSNNYNIEYQSILKSSISKMIEWLDLDEVFDFRNEKLSLDLKRKEFFEKKKVYIFGSGTKGKKVYNYLKRIEVEIEGFIDNNNDSQFKFIYDKKIYPLNCIYEDVFIIIASTWANEISLQLNKEGYKENIDYTSVKI